MIKGMMKIGSKLQKGEGEGEVVDWLVEGGTEVDGSEEGGEVVYRLKDALKWMVVREGEGGGGEGKGGEGWWSR